MQKQLCRLIASNMPQNQQRRQRQRVRELRKKITLPQRPNCLRYYANQQWRKTTTPVFFFFFRFRFFFVCSAAGSTTSTTSSSPFNFVVSSTVSVSAILELCFSDNKLPAACFVLTPTNAVCARGRCGLLRQYLPPLQGSGLLLTTHLQVPILVVTVNVFFQIILKIPPVTYTG